MIVVVSGTIGVSVAVLSFAGLATGQVTHPDLGPTPSWTQKSTSGTAITSTPMPTSGASALALSHVPIDPHAPAALRAAHPSGYIDLTNRNSRPTLTLPASAQGSTTSG